MMMNRRSRTSRDDGDDEDDDDEGDEFRPINNNNPFASNTIQQQQHQQRSSPPGVSGSGNPFDSRATSRLGSSRLDGGGDRQTGSGGSGTTTPATSSSRRNHNPFSPRGSTNNIPDFASATSRTPSSANRSVAGNSTTAPAGHDVLPPEYMYNPRNTEPVLYYLPKLVENVVARSGNSNSSKAGNSAAAASALAGTVVVDAADVATLRHLLKAAEEDIRLHRARVQAALMADMRMLRTYQLEMDPAWQLRQERRQAAAALQADLQNEATVILQELQESLTPGAVRGMTQAERTQFQLDRWQRALELYVHNGGGATMTQHELLKTGSTITSNQALKYLTWQSLFDKLLDGIGEDQDMSHILGQAAQMCGQLVETTRQAAADAAAHVHDVESAYQIRLQAHAMFARGCLQECVRIEDQFKVSGRAALQIGHQLEHAEQKRSQCETASILIRRWWILETLAEQEAATGNYVDMDAEIRGVIEPNACRMDPLFTKPENSLEAAKALKQLRAVVRSRGNATATGSATAGTSAGAGGSAALMMRDEASARRFDLTAGLIARVSASLEQRLLNHFSAVYTAGTAYDFAAKPRAGSVDWRELRSLAQSLLFFESGRSLHKRYVDMVVLSRFPELFHRPDEEGIDAKTMKRSDQSDDEGGAGSSVAAGFDLDTTRSKLSNLFHRVSEVCTAEFELIAHVFGAEGSRTDLMDGSEEMPLVVSRALLQRVISDPTAGLQARIQDVLESIDRTGDFDAGARKLDTFVVIHEKGAGLFSLLREAADRMILEESKEEDRLGGSEHYHAIRNAVESLKGFLTSQELALSNAHRQSYINLELRLLHHECCSSLDQAGCAMVKGPSRMPDRSLAEQGILEEYRAPVLPLHKVSLAKSGFTGILSGPLKQSVLRQPLIHATDSLARARLMFGTQKRGGETSSRVILSIYTQMCAFYGEGFLYPIVETLSEMLPTNPPQQPPQLPFDEEVDAPDLGVSPAFWVGLERVHSAAKAFDRELWAEQRAGSQRVCETLEQCGDAASMTFARDERVLFYSELERRGEAAILRALDALSTHIQWVLVTGGESMLATGGTRIFNQLTGQSGGPYAIPSGSSLETPNSPAVKSLTYSLRVQFVHVQAALTAQSLSSFWTALSMRLYDILVARLLQYYSISTVGAVILSRDVEALRSVAMLAGTEHGHWDNLRELLTLYMTPPDAIKAMLTGPEGESSKGLFQKAGRDQCLVFLSRRNDYRYRTASGPKKSTWVTDLLNELKVSDPTDGFVNIGLFAAGRMVGNN